MKQPTPTQILKDLEIHSSQVISTVAITCLWAVSTYNKQRQSPYFKLLGREVTLTQRFHFWGERRNHEVESYSEEDFSSVFLTGLALLYTEHSWKPKCEPFHVTLTVFLALRL